MMLTFKSGLTIGMLVAAMAMTAGCGDNDNGHGDNGNDNGGGPVRTSTPSRTSTPGGALTATPVATPVPTSTSAGAATQTVSFALASSTGLQGFKLEVAYPTAKGSFQGTAENTGCTAASLGIFLPNDNDAGTLKLVGAAAVGAITFPITIQCTFDATSTITVSDLTVTVTEAVQSSDGKPGDTSVLTVTPSVS